MFRRLPTFMSLSFAATVGLFALTSVLTAQPAQPVKPAAAPTDGTGIKRTQEENLKLFKQFSEQVLRLAQKWEKSDVPEDRERAKSLRDALKLIEEKGVEKLFKELIDGLSQKNLSGGDFNTLLGKDKKLMDALSEILSLLETESELAKIQKEIATLKEAIEAINKLKRDQEIIRAKNDGGKTDPNKLAKEQNNLAKRTQDVANKLDKGNNGKPNGDGSKQDPKSENKAEAKPGDNAGDNKPDTKENKSDGKGDGMGSPMGGDPKASDPKSGGDPKAGDPKNGGDKPNSPMGDPMAGDPKGGDPKPMGGNPMDPKGGDPKSGDSKAQGAGKGDSKPSAGKAGDGKPMGGDGMGMGMGQPSPGGSKGGGQPGGQPQPSKPKDPAAQDVQEAVPPQHDAEDNIKKGAPEDASKKQDEVIKKLEDALAKLEARLKQLREKELAKLLANLEERVGRMLRMQQEVKVSTEGIDKTIKALGGAKPALAEVQKSLVEGDKEGLIIAEAEKALKLMEGEGTAVVFAGVLAEVKKDMENVQTRLNNTRVGSDTQLIEQDIIDQLTMMKEALKKAKQDLENKPTDPKPGDPQPPGKPKLLDLLNELKLVRAQQAQLNNRTIMHNKQDPGEQARDPIVQAELKQLAERQKLLQEMIHKIQTAANQ